MQQNYRIPYGYSILNGTPVINKNEAAIIRAIYQFYIEGSTIEQAAVQARAELGRSKITHILRNSVYCGDSFYPAIIDRAVYDRAQEVAASRNHRRLVVESTDEVIQAPSTTFTWSDAPEKLHSDDTLSPSERAEAIYKLIQSKTD